MLPHGRGRGIRPQSADNGSVGVDLGALILDQSAEGDNSENKSQDERFEDDPSCPAAGDGLNISGDSNGGNIVTDIESMLKLLEEGSDIRGISKAIKSLCNTDKALSEVVEEINSKSKEELEYGTTAAKAFGNISQFEVSGVKLRDAVLRCIQNDFKNREELKTKSEKEYLLCVNLLCQVYQNMRLADGTYINILSVPILEYFTALLTNPTSQAIEIIGEQTHMIGEEIQRSKPDKFADFLVKVRKLIVEANPNLDIKSRCHLLHVLESHLLRWPSVLPDKTGEFYCSVLGDHVLTRATPQIIHPKTNSQDGLFDAGSLMLTSPGGGANMGFTGSTTTTRRVAQADPMPRNPNQFRPPPVSPGGINPNMFTQPPPMLPPNFGGAGAGGPVRPRGMGVQPPVRQPGMAGNPGGWQQNPGGGNPNAGLLMQDHQLERVAADIMAIRMPNTQVSPPVRHQPQPSGHGMNMMGRSSGNPLGSGMGRSVSNHGGGWQAMPPSIPPHLHPGNIPTAIVPPGVPPHNMPLRNHPAGDRDANNWVNPPPNLPSASVPPTLHGKHQDMYGAPHRQHQDNDPYQRGHRPMNDYQSGYPGGPPLQHQNSRSAGGSGRILPGADGGWSSGGMSAAAPQKDWNSGPQMGGGGRDNPRGGGGGSGFVIDTFDMSACGGGGSGSGGGGSGGGGGSSTSSRSRGEMGGGGSMWSSGQDSVDKTSRSGSVGWGNDKGVAGDSRGTGNWSSGGDANIGHWGGGGSAGGGGGSAGGGSQGGSGGARSADTQQWSTGGTDKPKSNDWGNNGTSNWSNPEPTATSNNWSNNPESSGTSNWKTPESSGTSNWSAPAEPSGASNWSNPEPPKPSNPESSGSSNWNNPESSGTSNWSSAEPSMPASNPGNQETSATNNWNNPASSGTSNWSNPESSGTGNWNNPVSTGSSNWNDMPANSQSISQSSMSPRQPNLDVQGSSAGVGGTKGSSWMGQGQPDSSIGEWGGAGAATNQDPSRAVQPAPSSGWGNGSNMGGDWGGGNTTPSTANTGSKDWSMGGGGGGERPNQEWSSGGMGGAGGGAEWSKGSNTGATEWSTKDSGVSEWGNKDSGGANWSDLATT